MVAELTGLPDVEHVSRPEGTEQDFAAIMAAVSGHGVAETHEALIDAWLSLRNGFTAPIRERTTLKVVDSVVVIDPLELPSGEDEKDPARVLELMDEQFIAQRAVALHHKQNVPRHDNAYQWTLFNGYGKTNSRGGKERRIRTINPHLAFIMYTYTDQLAPMIGRSLRHANGLQAYALSRETEA